MQCLILGATGRLGHMLQWAWRSDWTARPIWQCRDMPRGPLAKTGNWVTGDPLAPGAALCDAAQNADVVINLLGVTPGPGADLDLNTPLALAPWDLGATGAVMVASSAAVYGAALGDLLQETHPCAPLHPYGQAKADMETAVRAQNPRALILRIGNVAGADQLLGGLTADTDPVLHCFEDGTTPVRSYIGPRGLTQAIHALARAPQDWPDVVNIAAPHPVAMGDLLDAAGRTWTRAPAPDGLPARVAFDTARLGAFLDVNSLAHTAPDLVAEWQDWQRDVKGMA